MRARPGGLAGQRVRAGDRAERGAEVIPCRDLARRRAERDRAGDHGARPAAREADVLERERRRVDLDHATDRRSVFVNGTVVVPVSVPLT